MSEITVRIGRDVEREERYLLSRCGRAIRETRASDFFIVLPSRLKVERFRRALLSREGVPGIPGNPIGTLYSLVTRLLSDHQPPFQELPAGLKPFLLHEIVQEVIEKSPGADRFEGSLPGLVTPISSAIVDFKEALLSPDILDDFFRDDRYTLLSLTARIYGEYQERLKRKGWMDREDLFIALIECLDRGGTPPVHFARRIVFHGFYDLNPLQLKLLDSLSRITEKVEITLPMSGDLLNHPIPTRFIDSLVKLGARIDREEIEEMEERDRSESLSIEIVEAPDPIREVEYVAKRVKGEILGKGFELEEIDVVSERSSEYRRPLRRSFERFGIPVDGLTGDPLPSNPAVRILLSCLDSVSRGYERNAILNLLESRYLEAGIWSDRSPGSVVRDLVDLARITRGREEWDRRILFLKTEISRGTLWHPESGSYRRDPLSERVWRFRDQPERLLDACDRISAFLGVLDGIPPSHTLKGYLGETFQLAQRLELVRGILSQSDETLVARDLGAVHAFRESLDGWESLMTGDREVPLVRYLTLLRSAIGGVNYQAGALGGGLMVADPLEKRHHSSKVTIVCGAREGAFSATSMRPEVLGDEVRAEINRRAKRDALPMSTRIKEEEELIFGLLLERTRERVVITCPVFDNQSREIMPSRFIERLREDDRITFSRLRPSEIVPGPDQIWDRRDLIRYLLPSRLSVMPGSTRKEDGGGIDTLEEPLSGVARRSAIEIARRGGRAKGYDGRLTADDILNGLKDRFGPDMVYTPSVLGIYITCPFLFLVTKVWQLEGRETREVGMSRSDRGKIIHRVLNLFYRRFLDDFSWEKIESQIPDLRDLTGDVLKRYSQVDYLGPPGLFEIEARELQQTLSDFVRKDIEVSRDLGARPILLEYAIHSEDHHVTIETPVGEVRVGGRVDRVDALRSPEDGCLVMDYKTGYSPTIRDVLDGKSVQVPLYIIGLEKRGYNILMGYYYHVPEGNQRARMGPGMELITNRGSRQGADWDTIRRVVESKIGEVVASVRGGDFRTTPRECPAYCDLRGLCRLDPYYRKK